MLQQRAAKDLRVLKVRMQQPVVLFHCLLVIH